MSFRNWWPVRTAHCVRLIGAAGLPSTRMSSAVPAMPSAPLHHDLREAVRALDEVAVGVGRQQRHVVDVGIGEVDAEQSRACALTTAQVAMPPISTSSAVPKLAVGAQVAIGDQLAGRTGCRRVQLVGAQEHLVRGMRGVGLVLVDERRGGVLLLVDVVGRARGCRRRRASSWWRASATMKRVGGSRRGAEDPSAHVTADRPACSGMKIVPLPPLVTRSRP